MRIGMKEILKTLKNGEIKGFMQRKTVEFRTIPKRMSQNFNRNSVWSE